MPIEAEILARAERVFLERWYALDRASAELIIDTVARVDDQTLADHPALLGGALISLHVLDLRSTKGGDQSQLLERLSILVEISSRKRRSTHDQAQWLMMSMMAARWRLDFPRATEISEQLGALQPAVDVRAALFDDGQEDMRPGQIAFQRGLTTLLAGDSADAMNLFAKAYRAGGRPPFRHFATVNAAANAAMVAAIEGHNISAERWLSRISSPGPIPGWAEDLVLVGAKIARAVLATDLIELDAAEPVIREIEDAGERLELWPFVLHAATAYDLARNAPLTAYERLRQVEFERNITISREPIAGYLVVRAYLDTLIANGEGALALRIATDASNPARVMVPVARIKLLAGDNVGAARVAAQAMKLSGIPKRDMWESKLIYAVAALRQGNVDSAIRYFMRVLTALPHALPTMLMRAPLQDINDLYALTGAEVPLASSAADPEPFTIVVLTARERQVLRYLADGVSPAQIADLDVTSLHTVRTHIKRIYRKLNVGARADAVARGSQLGLL